MLTASQPVPWFRPKLRRSKQQQPDLAAKSVNGAAQRGEQPRDQAAAFVDVAGQILEHGERLAGKAEPAQARLERAADLARIGVDP